MKVWVVDADGELYVFSTKERAQKFCDFLGQSGIVAIGVEAIMDDTGAMRQ